MPVTPPHTAPRAPATNNGRVRQAIDPITGARAVQAHPDPEELVKDQTDRADSHEDRESHAGLAAESHKGDRTLPSEGGLAAAAFNTTIETGVIEPLLASAGPLTPPPAGPSDPSGLTRAPATAQALTALLLGTSLLSALNKSPSLPAVSLSLDDSLLTEGETGSLTLAFERPVQDLELSDLLITGATARDLRPTADPSIWLATIVADPDLEARADGGAEIEITIAAGSFRDGAGRPGLGTVARFDADTALPELETIAGDAAADRITLDYDRALDETAVIPTNRFEVFQGQQALPVSSIIVVHDKVQLTVPGLLPGAFTFRYAAPDAGDDGGEIQSLSGNDARSAQRGLVADGYIEGARIYLDDGDGVFEPDADLDTGILTAVDGSFILNAYWLGRMEAEGRTLLALGGINTDTGVPNIMTLAAPTGATVINPLTTLAQALIADGAADSLDEATALLRDALGLSLPSGARLADADPIAAAEQGDASALANQKLAAKIATILTQARTQQSRADLSTIAEQGLIDALVEAVVQRADEIRTGGAQASSVLNLSDAATVSALALRGEAIADAIAPETSLSWSPNDLLALSNIAVGNTLSDVSGAQQALAGSATSAPPSLKTLLPGMNGLPDRILIELPGSEVDRSGLETGDQIRVLDAAGTVITRRTLSAADLAAGRVELPVDSADQALQTLSIQIVDSEGYQGKRIETELFSAPTQPGDTLDLGALLTPMLQSALQGLANVEIPFVGSVGELMNNSGVALWLQDRLATLPKLVLKQGSPTLKSMEGSGFYFGFDDSDNDPIDDTGGDTESDDSGWVIDPGSDSGSDFEPEEGSDNGGFEGLDPSDGTGDTDGSSGGSDDNGFVDWNPADGGDASAYRFTGPQTNLPAPFQSFNYDSVTGAFELVIIDPEEWFNEGFGGLMGGNGAMGFIDANLAGHRVLEVRLFGQIQYELDAYNIATLDTTRSGLKLHADIGVAPGSTVGGVLGPFSLTGQDQPTTHISSTAKRTNTGAEGGVTISFKDFDGTADQRLSLLKGTDVLLGKLATNGLTALDDALNWRAYLEGRLSAQTELGLNFGNVVDSAVAGPLMDLFALKLGADITTPFKFVYDSVDASQAVSEWGTVHLDDVTLALAPLITQASGSAVSAIDSVMQPVYAIENFFSYELPIPTDVGAASAPLNLPSWMPGFAKDFINQVVNVPKSVVSGVAAGVIEALDVDDNGKVTVLEAIEQSARHYAGFVNFADELWDTMVALTPGLKDTLNASGYGAAVVAVMESLDAQKQFFATFFDYFDYFKATLTAIDQLEGLSTLHALAAAEIASQQTSVLGLPLGSYTWDIRGGRFDTVDSGNRYSLIDRALPPRSDPEPELKPSVAIQRLIDAAVADQVDELGTGAGGLHEFVYFQAGVTGVTRDNLATINSLLDSKPIREWILLRDPKFDMARPGAWEDDPDYGVRVVGKLQQIVDAWLRVERVGKNRGTAEDKAGLIEAFGTLELLSSSNTTLTSERARTLLLKIMEYQPPQQLDSQPELQSLVEAWSALVRLVNHPRTYNVGLGDSISISLPIGQAALTHNQLDRLGLKLLNQSDSTHLDAVNQSIFRYAGDYANLYTSVRAQVQDLNAAYEKARGLTADEIVSVDSAFKAALAKISAAAEANDAAQTLTIDDFKAVGVSGLSASSLAGFNSFLDSTVIGQSKTKTLNDLQKLVDAYRLLLDTAGASLDSTKAGPFYSAIDLLLQADRAQELENIPYANSTKSRPDSRLPALPLLQGIVSTRTDAQVDTYAELDAIVTATREVLMASMANEKLWVLAGLQKHAPWKSDASALYQAIARFKDYKTTLSVDQLKLIGFPEATEETLNTVKSKLASYANGQYELTRVDYWEAVVGTNRSVSRTAEYYKPTAPKKLLTLADLGSSAAPPADQISKLLEAVPNVKAFWDQLKALGVEFPILNQLGPDLAKALWDNELVEFIRFTPDLPSIEDAGFAYNYNLAQLLPFYDTINNVVPFSLPVGLEASASVIPRLSIGVDNYWLQSIRNQEGKPFLDLLANSIYLFDEYEVDGTMIDLPELELDLSLLVTAGAMLGQAKGLANLYAEIFGGLNFSLEADLKADDTGKLRLADLFDSLLDLPPDTGLSSVIAAGPGNLFAMLGDNILDLVDFKGALDLTAGGELGLNVDLTPEDKSNLGAVTQALSDAYAAAASWLDLETHFNWKMGGEFTIPIFQFDTANGSFLLNV